MNYSKEAYDIDLNTLLPELNKIITSHELSHNLQITKKEYSDRLHLSAISLKELRGYTNEPFFIIYDDEPSFDFWLSFYLSTKKPHQVSLILDQYFKKTNDQDLFVNRIEFSVLRIIEQNIFHNIDSQLKEISNWIREKRKEYEEKANILFQIININLTQINVVQIVNNYWVKGTDNSISPNNTETTENYGLIESPYDVLFIRELKVFCEDSSIPYLEKLFQNGKIDSKIIFKANFKKISILRPIRELIDRGFIKMNQKKAAKWLADHFAIRKEDGVSPFSFSSCEKRLARVNHEPENAQIKYKHWFKK